MVAIVIADALPECPVRCTRAELLDPGMLVGRDGLGGELAADPVGRLGQYDRAAGPKRGQRRGAAPEAAPHDHHIRGDLGLSQRGWACACRPGLGRQQGCQPITTVLEKSPAPHCRDVSLGSWSFNEDNL